MLGRSSASRPGTRTSCPPDVNRRRPAQRSPSPGARPPGARPPDARPPGARPLAAEAPPRSSATTPLPCARASGIGCDRDLLPAELPPCARWPAAPPPGRRGADRHRPSRPVRRCLAHSSRRHRPARPTGHSRARWPTELSVTVIWSSRSHRRARAGQCHRRPGQRGPGRHRPARPPISAAPRPACGGLAPRTRASLRPRPAPRAAWSTASPGRPGRPAGRPTPAPVGAATKLAP